MKVTNLFARGSSATFVRALAVAITLYFVFGPVATADAQKFRFFGTTYSDWSTLVITGDGKVHWKILKNENPSQPPGILRDIPFGEAATDEIPNSGDYTGDGLDDYVVYRDNSGLIPPVNTYIIGRSDGGPTQWTQYGDWETDFIGGEGDYDGDNKMDLTIQRQAGVKMEWWVLRSSTNTITVFYWGAWATDIPLGGADYTGDGIDDPCVARVNATTRAITWFVGTDAGAGITQLQWGNYNTDWIVPGGDYDGDGKADFMVWRGYGLSSNGVWYLRTASGATTYTQFGIPGEPGDDQALRSGDYDGDGKTDIAIYRQTDNSFWVYRSSGGGGQYQKFGTAGEEIVPLGNFGVY